jgi:hypothetical protein
MDCLHSSTNILASALDWGLEKRKRIAFWLDAMSDEMFLLIRKLTRKNGFLFPLSFCVDELSFRHWADSQRTAQHFSFFDYTFDDDNVDDITVVPLKKTTRDGFSEITVGAKEFGKRNLLLTLMLDNDE